MRTPAVLLAVVAGLLPSTACQCKQAPPEATPAPAAAPAAKDDASAKKYYALPGLSHGLLQSPVNILSDQTGGGQHDIALNLHHADPDHLTNKGSTIELEFPQGSTVTFDGLTYELKQLHFHTPSEHQIDGVTYPMEVHVVNMIEPKTPDEPPRYLVMAFLYRMGEEDRFIASFLDEVPEQKGEQALKAGQVHISPAERERVIDDYYHYRGSLTTPPHTETVQWLVQRRIVEASPEQIRRINLLEGNNARHVQPLYGREVDD